MPLIRSWKIPWLFTDFWTIFTDLKLARWMIKYTGNQWSKLLFQQTPLKSIIFLMLFERNIIPWLITDFYKLLRFSLTLYKIPWLFPDLEKFLFLPDFSLTMATLKIHDFSVKTCPHNIGPYNVGTETHWQYLLRDTWLQCENLPTQYWSL